MDGWVHLYPTRRPTNRILRNPRRDLGTPNFRRCPSKKVLHTTSSRTPFRTTVLQPGISKQTNIHSRRFEKDNQINPTQPTLRVDGYIITGRLWVDEMNTSDRKQETAFDSGADNGDEEEDGDKDNESADRDKRRRDMKQPIIQQQQLQQQQQPGQASGMEERPSKTRKIAVSDEEYQVDDDDPVAFARRALEMFRKEVEADGDFQEPDTTPGPGEMESTLGTKIMTPSQKGSQTMAPRTVPEDISVSRWHKAGRQPMITQEDDPSIL